MIPKEWLIAKPTPSYTSALVTFLADELASDPTVAGAIFWRAYAGLSVADPEERSLSIALACRLIANAQAGKIEFGAMEMLRERGGTIQITCERANPG